MLCLFALLRVKALNHEKRGKKKNKNRVESSKNTFGNGLYTSIFRFN